MQSVQPSEKEELQKYIQKWVAVDNHLQQLQDKTKTMREWKKKLTNKISEIMQQNNCEDSILEIPDGELRLSERNEYSGLTLSFVEKCMREIIPDDSQVSFVMDYLRDHREVKTVVDIRRKKNLIEK